MYNDYHAIIKLDESILAECTNTAKKIANGRSDYYTREQGNSGKSKTQENFINGLFAEKATYDFLVDCGFAVRGLRLTPHEYPSWESDLTANGFLSM